MPGGGGSPGGPPRASHPGAADAAHPARPQTSPFEPEPNDTTGHHHRAWPLSRRVCEREPPDSAVPEPARTPLLGFLKKRSCRLGGALQRWAGGAGRRGQQCLLPLGPAQSTERDTDRLQNSKRCQGRLGVRRRGHATFLCAHVRASVCARACVSVCVHLSMCVLCAHV